MSVRSARVQATIRGDDALLEHQVVADVALDAVPAKAPVQINSGDSVLCLYATQQTLGQPQVPDLSVTASPLGPVPTSRIQASLSQAQTTLLAVGPAQTVRVEISRASGLKETHYLFEELDVLERGFPLADSQVDLP